MANDILYSNECECVHLHLHVYMCCTLMHAAAKREKKKNINNGGRASKDIEQLLTIFDVLVCGDGEFAIFEALEIDKGLVDADNTKSPLFLTKKQFSDLPMPARHLIDFSTYRIRVRSSSQPSLFVESLEHVLKHITQGGKSTDRLFLCYVFGIGVQRTDNLLNISNNTSRHTWQTD